MENCRRIVRSIGLIMCSLIWCCLISNVGFAAGVGSGARLFVTKCFPSHGNLTIEDFRKLRDAGFTVAVDMWKEDLRTFCARAGQLGLDVVSWNGGLPASPDAQEQWVAASGKTVAYARPCSPYSWQKIGDDLVKQATLSIDHPNLKGAVLDFEVYDENRGELPGFSESYDAETFKNFMEFKGLDMPLISAPADRSAFLKKRELVTEYVQYSANLLLREVRKARRRVDEVNPGFQVGVYGWGVFQITVLRGMSTSQAPSLFMDAETYGRTPYDGKFAGGYNADEPDRRGLRHNLIGNYMRAKASREMDFPVISLSGHYPQASGPADGTQYKFTARDTFNSVAAADGYWVWTDWYVPTGYKGSQQDWTDDMMAYWAQANTALDSGDMTWASRQPIQVPDPNTTAPDNIITLSDTIHSGEISVWDPVSGECLRHYGKDKDDPNVAITVGQTFAGISDSPVITVSAKGMMRIYDGNKGKLVKSVRLSIPEGKTTARIVVNDKSILIYPSDGTAALAFDASGAPLDASTFDEKLVGSFIDGENTGLDITGSCVRLYDIATGKTTKLIEIGHGLRSIAVADVDAVPGNELITLNAGIIKTWDGHVGVKLLSFPVGHEMVSMATRSVAAAIR